MQSAFIQHLQVIGVLETEEEIEEIENLTKISLNQHHQLQDWFGLAFLKREVENEETSDLLFQLTELQIQNGPYNEKLCQTFVSRLHQT